MELQDVFSNRVSPLSYHGQTKVVCLGSLWSLFAQQLVGDIPHLALRFSFNNPCLLGESLSTHFCIFFKLMMLGICQGFPGHLLIPLGKYLFRSFDSIIKLIVSMNYLLLDLLDIVYENVSPQSLAVCGRSVHQLYFD